MNTVRTNPVPLALIGAGVAWLLLGRSRYQHSLQEAGATLKEKAGDLSVRAREKASELSGRLRESSGEFAGKTSSSARDFGRSAQERAFAAKDSLSTLIHKNPFGMTLAAFGAGALLGYALPETRKEQELMGSARESVLSRAKETAQKTFQKAQHAAEKAVQSAEEEFRKTA